MTPRAVCRTAKCGAPQRARGLCSGCYGMFRRLLTERAFTDEAAVTAGLVEPHKKSGVKPRSLFLAAAARAGLLPEGRP